MHVHGVTALRALIAFEVFCFDSDLTFETELKNDDCSTPNCTCVVYTKECTTLDKAVMTTARLLLLLDQLQIVQSLQDRVLQHGTLKHAQK